MQSDSTIVLDALMYKRGISNREITTLFHKATLLLVKFDHVDLQYIPRCEAWGACGAHSHNKQLGVPSSSHRPPAVLCQIVLQHRRRHMSLCIWVHVWLHRTTDGMSTGQAVTSNRSAVSSTPQTLHPPGMLPALP